MSDDEYNEYCPTCAELINTKNYAGSKTCVECEDNYCDECVTAKGDKWLCLRCEDE